MKYTITRLDGRYSYREQFEYYIGFSGTMARGHGPLYYNHAIKWFINTYGWSAEVREYMKIQRWTATLQLSPKLALHMATDILEQQSEHCNPHWSWTNAYEDLRVYVASDRELAFFQLAHPVDQKT